MRGFSDANGSWKMICSDRRAFRSASPSRLDEVLAVEARFAVDVGAAAQQLHERLAGRRLAAPGFADERERPAGLQRERDAVDRLHVPDVRFSTPWRIGKCTR